MKVKEKKLRFAAGITLYNYNNTQINRLIEYSSSFEIVFFFDNSEPGYKCNYENLPKNIILLSENRNCGLPYAFNKIIEDQRTQELDFLCTLDQDSVFTKEDIDNIKRYLAQSESIENIGVIAPYVKYGYGTHKKNNEVESKKWVITSGSFVNLNILRKEKMTYDNAYFIDKFEIDLCQQMVSKGYKVLMYHGSELLQSLGEYSGHKHPNHSPLRHYYLFRNRLYFNHKFYKAPKRWLLNTLQTSRHVFLIIFYEERKKEKLGFILPAFRDYIDGRMGKIAQENIG